MRNQNFGEKNNNNFQRIINNFICHDEITLKIKKFVMIVWFQIFNFNFIFLSRLNIII